eukprot:CAMPEP_0174730472 /NCGR_PEP_ID=MMETSP1094-20130205/55698_1 /TAXON_ID=156173 /ORGANISM="Chrysochromulina brevifilum, Strain UTEX LB 985" /LENGTH=86 /DNA_ID=CAMNT_0015932743 /DNA_START=211 /DNA_END=471 /DNA_ORIENTATION=+
MSHITCLLAFNLDVTCRHCMSILDSEQHEVVLLFAAIGLCILGPPRKVRRFMGNAERRQDALKDLGTRVTELHEGRLCGQQKAHCE